MSKDLLNALDTRKIVINNKHFLSNYFGWTHRLREIIRLREVYEYQSHCKATQGIYQLVRKVGD